MTLDDEANALVTMLKSLTNKDKRLTDTDWCTSCSDCKYSVRVGCGYHCKVMQGFIAKTNKNFCVRHSNNRFR